MDEGLTKMYMFLFVNWADNKYELYLGKHASKLTSQHLQMRKLCTGAANATTYNNNST